MQLPVPTPDNLVEELGTRERAVQAAEAEEIQPSDTTRDEGQSYIVQAMNAKRLEGRQKVAESLGSYEKRREEIAKEVDQLPRQPLSEMVEGDARLTLESREESLLSAMKREVEAVKAYRAFKVRHGILREPRYPQWRVFHWAIVAVLLAAESVLNARFFAQANPFGLLGGVLQASTVSILNIGFGLLGGMKVLPWRNKKSLKKEPTVAPTAVAILLGAIILVFNLATAHYRVLLETNPEQAITLALRHLFNQPLSIDNFDAWTLFFFGLMFSTVAWLEGYSSDDPLRDYGRLHREYRDAEQKVAELKNATRSAAVSQIDANKEELLSSARRANSLVTEYNSLLSRSKETADYFQGWTQQLEEVTDTLLQRYRSFYLQVHELQPRPSYFEEEFRFDEQRPFVEEEQRWHAGETGLEEMRRIVERLEENREEGLRNELEIVKKVSGMTDRFLQHMEEAAGKRVRWVEQGDEEGRRSNDDKGGAESGRDKEELKPNGEEGQTKRDGGGRGSAPTEIEEGVGRSEENGRDTGNVRKSQGEG